jgi:hypothetical protein
MAVAMTEAEIAVAIAGVVAVGDAAEGAIAAAARQVVLVARATCRLPSTLHRRAANREATKIAAHRRAVTTTGVRKARGPQARRLRWKRPRSRSFFRVNPWQSIAGSPRRRLHLRQPLSMKLMMYSPNRWRMRRAPRLLSPQRVLAAAMFHAASPAVCLDGSWPRPAQKPKEARRVNLRTQRKKFPRLGTPSSNLNPFGMMPN